MFAYPKFVLEFGKCFSFWKKTFSKNVLVFKKCSCFQKMFTFSKLSYRIRKCSHYQFFVFPIICSCFRNLFANFLKCFNFQKMFMFSKKFFSFKNVDVVIFFGISKFVPVLKIVRKCSSFSGVWKMFAFQKLITNLKKRSSFQILFVLFIICSERFLLNVHNFFKIVRNLKKMFLLSKTVHNFFKCPHASIFEK